VAGLAGYWITRRMHYRLTVELLLAVVVAAGVGAWVVSQLARGDTQARVLVRDAYDTVAGVRDEIALVSQQKALETIAIFDQANASQHAAEFGDYDLQVQQGLCGFANCSATPFLDGGGLKKTVVAAALDGQDRFGFARTPLVANVRFAGEADGLEAARVAYQSFLKSEADLINRLQTGDTAGALQINDGAGQAQFTSTVNALDKTRSAARTVYDRTWRSVLDAATIGKWLAGAEIVAGVLLVSGLWRRRQELFVANIH
jgi:hypothetical protein